LAIFFFEKDPKIHFIELSILRNKLLHLFYEEALWSCSVHTASKTLLAGVAAETGAPTVESVLPDVLFMDELLSIEFIRNRSSLNQRASFLEVLGDMSGAVRRGGQVFEINGSRTSGRIVVAASKGETTHAFLCSVSS
jgi:hypothetical protein